MTAGDCTGTLTEPRSRERDWPVLRAATRTLPNGLRLILAENHTVPLVWLSWVSQAGFEWEPPELSGVASLAPVLLREGTARRSAAEITEQVDDLGADLVSGFDWDSAFLNLGVLSDDVATGAELLLDMAWYARFPPEAVARLKQRRLAEAERRARQPRTLADDAFARVLYADTTYGRPPLGTRATLPRLEAADVAAFHDTHYRAGTSCLVAAGSFDGDALADLLGAFDPPPAPRAPRPPAPPLAFAPDAAPPSGLTVIDLPRAPQTELRVGHDGVPRDHPDLPALQVLNALLGGGPCSRLAGTLRQRLGLTYHVRSRFAARRGGGPFVVETGVASGAAGAALAAITGEIQRLRDQRVPADELEQAKRRLLGAEILQFQSMISAGWTLREAAFEGEPVSRFERARRAIAAVEPDALQELARRHLHPERLRAVAVGPAAALASQFTGEGAFPAPGARIDIVGGEAMSPNATDGRR